MHEATETARLFTGDLFADLIQKAGESPRRRTNFNFHGGAEEPCHRFLNVMMQDTYIAPHRHVTPLKAESFLLLEGQGAFFVFDDAGEVLRCDLLDAGAARHTPDVAGSVGIDVTPGVWHSMVVLSPHVVCFEVKPGPYDPATDKEFASFAPVEGADNAHEYLEWMRQYAREKHGLA